MLRVRSWVRWAHRLVGILLAVTISAAAQDPAPKDEEPAQKAETPTPEGEPGAPSPKPGSPGTLQPDVWAWLAASLSQEDDVDGPINTDRPTFTPANTVVPPGRLQFESGFTFNAQHSNGSRSYIYDLPELAMRYGLMNRVEFRTFWLGDTLLQTQAMAGGPWSGSVGGAKPSVDSVLRRQRGSISAGGLSDMEVGFKWQLLETDKEKKWRPTTALITSIIAPTGGTSYLSAQTVEPYVNLIYGWSLTEKLQLLGSTGYLGMRQQFISSSGARGFDVFQRYHQSLVFFYSAAERTTLFYEWYILTYTNASDNRPLNYMDGGILYRLTTNMQLDIRAGFGLSGRPADFFTGAGFSVRF